MMTLLSLVFGVCNALLARGQFVRRRASTRTHRVSVSFLTLVWLCFLVFDVLEMSRTVATLPMTVSLLAEGRPLGVAYRAAGNEISPMLRPGLIADLWFACAPCLGLVATPRRRWLYFTIGSAVTLVATLLVGMARI